MHSYRSMWTTIEQLEARTEEQAVTSPDLPTEELVDINETELEFLSETESRQLNTQSGKIGWALLWLLGVPLPLLLIAYLIWGR